jgi:hypothetical protein
LQGSVKLSGALNKTYFIVSRKPEVLEWIPTRILAQELAPVLETMTHHINVDESKFGVLRGYIETGRLHM